MNEILFSLNESLKEDKIDLVKCKFYYKLENFIDCKELLLELKSNKNNSLMDQLKIENNLLLLNYKVFF